MSENKDPTRLRTTTPLAGRTNLGKNMIPQLALRVLLFLVLEVSTLCSVGWIHLHSMSSTPTGDWVAYYAQSHNGSGAIFSFVWGLPLYAIYWRANGSFQPLAFAIITLSLGASVTASEMGNWPGGKSEELVQRLCFRGVVVVYFTVIAYLFARRTSAR